MPCPEPRAVSFPRRSSTVSARQQSVACWGRVASEGRQAAKGGRRRPLSPSSFSSPRENDSRHQAGRRVRLSFSHATLVASLGHSHCPPPVSWLAARSVGIQRCQPGVCLCSSAIARRRVHGGALSPGPLLSSLLPLLFPTPCARFPSRLLACGSPLSKRDVHFSYFLSSLRLQHQFRLDCRLFRDALVLAGKPPADGLPPRAGCRPGVRLCRRRQRFHRPWLAEHRCRW